MRKPDSIIVLLYIFHIIHPQRQKRSVQPFCFWGEHSKGLSNQADFELDMINAISAADIAFIMSRFASYNCELIECSRPIRFFIVSLMYNDIKRSACLLVNKILKVRVLYIGFLLFSVQQYISKRCCLENWVFSIHALFIENEEQPSEKKKFRAMFVR